MDTPPLISVLMPAYNAEKFIGRAIESMLQQTYAHIELLIADDASRDRTRKIIDTYNDPRIRRFHQDTNQGYLKTCNALFAKAQGDFITFQDADDYSALNRLEKQLAAFDAQPELGACGTNYVRVTEEGQEISCSHYFLSYEHIQNALPKEYHFVGSSLMIRRTVYEAVGGYHPFFDRIGAEDHHWAWQIMEYFPMINLKEPLYFYRHNKNSIAGDWSDNPRKIYTARLLAFIIQEKKEKQLDVLEEPHIHTLIAYERTLSEPYRQDKSLFFRKLSNKYFYEKDYEKAFSLIIRAIKKSYFKVENYKDMFFYIKSIVREYLSSPKKK